MPPSSLSQTPFFQYLLSSLPSLREQIKDAVTASMKQWLLEIRNISAEVGGLALEAMETRTRRWRARRDKDLTLRTSRVGSAVEMVSYENRECEISVDSWCSAQFLPQLTFWTTTEYMLTSNHYSSVSTSTPPSTPLRNSNGHTRPTVKYEFSSCMLVDS
jgi:hypothetical protein